VKEWKEDIMKKATIVQVVKSVVVAYILSGIILLLLAFLMYRFDVAEGVIRGGIIFAYVFSCFVGGILASKKQNGRKYLWGILGGSLYYLILFIVSIICTRSLPENIVSSFMPLLLCVAGGMLGGMLQAGRN